MLVIFDCDGVIVDSEPLAARVLEQYLRDLSYPVIVDASMHGRFVGLSLSAMQRMLETESGVALPADFIDELVRRDAVAFRAELTAIPGIADVLAGLTVPYCLASSGSRRKIDTSLTLTGLGRWFEGRIFSATDDAVAHGKPAPDLFLHAAAEMEAATADCIVIEDSVNGVKAGKAAGMRTLGFTGGGHCDPDHGESLIAVGADAVFAKMTELPSLL